MPIIENIPEVNPNEDVQISDKVAELWACKEAIEDTYINYVETSNESPISLEQFQEQLIGK